MFVVKTILTNRLFKLLTPTPEPLFSVHFFGYREIPIVYERRVDGDTCVSGTGDVPVFSRTA